MRIAILFAAALAMTSAAQAADANNGRIVFGRCAVCHTTAKGGSNGLGPNLFGIVGRKAATAPNFMYSGAMKNSGISWTADKLKAWIAAPARLVPGTKMAFGGISNAKQIDDVVAYLATLK